MTVQKNTSRSIPIAPLVWVGLSVLLLIMTLQPVTVSEDPLRTRIPGPPRLGPNLWLPTFAADDDTILEIRGTSDLSFGLGAGGEEVAEDAAEGDAGEAEDDEAVGLQLGSSQAEDEIEEVWEPSGVTMPLFIFTFLFAGVELAMAIAYRGVEEKLVRPLVRSLGVFLVFWSFFGHEPFWDAVLGMIFPRSPQLLHPNTTLIAFAGQHLELVLVASLITISGGLFIGIMVTRESFREFLPLVTNVVNAGQTIPTLAIVAIMAPIIGFGFWPAIIALVAYGLLPVVRNTIAGLESVSPFIKDSARGMGMTPAQILFSIEIPIASRIIMAGVRTSTVIGVGTATLGAFVGSGGLGLPISSGLSMSIDPFILLGALPAALLAILIDYILGRVEYVITPRGLQIEQ